MKIGVIGSGSVGVGVCNYVLTLGHVRELVLYNRTLSRAKGEILDFQHTSSLTFSKNTKLVATDDYRDLKDADIIAITAGVQIQEGQNRLDLAHANSVIGVEIAKELEKVAPNAILIVVTNPCDIVSYFISSNTGYDRRKVISAGCVVDTARLMSIVSKRVGVDPKNVFGYILGEHGNNCFTPKSLISIAGQPADYYCASNNLEPIDANQLLEDVKNAGYEIFKYKQNTTHGVSASVFRIIQVISVNEHSVLPIGTLLSGEYGLDNVVLSLPCVVNADGVQTVLTHPFTDEEKEKLFEISDHLQNVIQDVSKTSGLRMHPFKISNTEYNLPKNDRVAVSFDVATSTAARVFDQTPVGKRDSLMNGSKNIMDSFRISAARRMTTASSSPTNPSFQCTFLDQRSLVPYPSLLSTLTSSDGKKRRRRLPLSSSFRGSNKVGTVAAMLGSGVLAALAVDW